MSDGGRSSLPPVWPVILPLALSASPADALRGLGWVARGRRVRGWNLIHRAASAHPAYYRRWIAKAEGRIIRNFCAEQRSTIRPAPVGCLILGAEPEGVRRTLHSVRASLGSMTPVWMEAAVAGIVGATLIHADTPLGEWLARLGPELDWLLPLRAGDMVSPALGAVLARVAPDPSTNGVVFWDEDRSRDGRRQDPWLKPGWDPMLLGDGGGVMGAGLIAMSRMRAVAQQHWAAADLAGVVDALRWILAGEDIAPLHLPLILTHRRSEPAGTGAMARADVGESPTIVAPAVWPDVSIIIPVRDRPDLLRSCLAGLRMLVYPGRLEIAVVDNDSVEPETRALLARLIREDAVLVLPHPGPFNFAAMVNYAVANTSGEVLCLLNNDVEPLDGSWLETMVRHAVRQTVGAVGARLLYPDGTIQHAGVAIGIGGAAGHVQKGVDPRDPRFSHWHSRSRTVSAVTAACMVVERCKFRLAGGMDAGAFPVDFNDVDLCLKLEAAGLHNVLAVEATLIHHESQSRGTRRSPEAAARFARELALLQVRWNTRTAQDPHHSPRFRREAERCTLAFE
ncbi:glycosyltransferase family 2 protein [Sphingomonas bacterium]|uniref:glycosyltransferase family 2 protein n=1 Tax=Sphingomonas bacterium TaxID=1895847 RepID=UPI001575547B|nr:glycosyltransferase [Sphingomonas bacterium]